MGLAFLNMRNRRKQVGRSRRMSLSLKLSKRQCPMVSARRLVNWFTTRWIRNRISRFWLGAIKRRNRRIGLFGLWRQHHLRVLEYRPKVLGRLRTSPKRLMLSPSARTLISGWSERRKSSPSSWRLTRKPNLWSTHGVGMALQEIEESPLTDEIVAQAPPPKFVIPKINVYNGTAGPTDHLLHYRNIMALNTSEDYLMCRVFPASLHGQALVWFHKIPAKSVSYFKELSRLFLAQYSCNRRQIKDLDYLFNLKKSVTESIRDSTKRFWASVLQVDNCNEQSAVVAYKKGLPVESKLYQSLVKNRPETLEDLLLLVPNSCPFLSNDS